MRKEGIQITGPVTVLRQYLPDSDFAFLLWDRDKLFINKRALKILIDAKVLTMNDFHLTKADSLSNYGEINKSLYHKNRLQKVELLEAPYPGAIVYDKQGPILPIDEFDEERLNKIREKGKANWEYHLAHPLPERVEAPPRRPDLKRVLKMLQDIKNRYPRNFKDKTSKEKLEEFTKNISFVPPEALLKLLNITSAFSLNTVYPLDYTFDVGELIHWTHSEREHKEYITGDPLPEKWFCIGYNGDGTCYYLDLGTSSKVLKGDYRVVWTHEDYTVQKEWDSLAEFLENIAEQELTPE